MRIPSNRPPTHPGEMLREEFMLPMGLDPETFARRVGLEPAYLRRLFAGEERIGVAEANALARTLDTTARFWLNLQTRHDFYEEGVRGLSCPIERYAPEAGPCEHCESRRVRWHNCKLVCEACGQITKTCADL